MMQAKLTRNHYLCIFGIAVFVIAIRFLHLGIQALSENEANLALQALSTAKGQMINWSGEPLYLALTSLLFTIFDQNNFIARLIPAIFGTLLIAIPFLYRKNTGNWETIILTAFLAIDPSLVSLSRTAGGSTISLFLLGLAVYLLINRKIIKSGVVCGLVLLGGAGFWSALIPLVIAVIIWLLIDRESFKKQEQPITIINETIHNRLFWLVLILTAILIGTLFLSYPRSLNALAGSLTDYFHTWKSREVLSFPLFLLGIIFYFPLGLIFGVWGGIRSLIEKNSFGKFLFIWLLAGLVLILVNPGRELTQLFWLVFPLYTLAAIEIKHHINSEGGEFIPTMGVAILIMTIAGFLWFNFGKLTYGGDQNQLIIAVGGGIGILLVSAILIVLGWSRTVALKGYIWGVLVILFLYTFSTGWRVSGVGTGLQSEMIGSAQTVPQLGLIKKTINEISNWNAGSSTGIGVTVVGLDSSVLEWGLKDFSKINFLLATEKDQQPEVILAGTDQAFAFQDQYRGQDFIYEQTINWQNFTAMDWISWLVHRKVSYTNTSVVLWVRADQFPGGTISLPSQ
jgi:hypothetical protein